MKEFEEDLVVPTVLWKAMEHIYKPMALDPEGQVVKETQKNEKQKESEALMKKKPPLDPFSFHVFLIEKTPGVLGGQNFDLKFPVGGGVLDYRYFVPESRDGTFYLKVKYDQDMDPKETHIFYLSDAKIRQVDDKPLGNGCDRYFDISEYWKKSMAGDGLVLNTVKQRHISVTSGVLFFVAPYKGKLRIAHLTVRDSRHRDLLCK